MYKIIVRSKRDADALKNTIKRYYKGWSIEVETLHGARSLDKVIERLELIMEDDKFNILLLGRDDEKVGLEVEKQIYNVNFVVHIVPKVKVRNLRLERLFKEVELARSKIKLFTMWDHENATYLFFRSNRGINLFEEYKELHDIFLSLSGKLTSTLSELIGVNLGKGTLIVRKPNNIHEVFSGPIKVGIIEFETHNTTPRARRLNNNTYDINLDGMLKSNIKVIETFEKISTSFLEKFKDKVDKVAVPWSGGKDSTLTLILALKVFGKRKVIPIYSDTGVEFPQSQEYIDKISKILGIDYVRVKANIDRELERRGYLPTQDDRWCMLLKVKSIEEYIFENFRDEKVLLVVGDRDVESETRERKPYISVKENVVKVTPIRMWATHHIQLYFMYNNIPFNPLYELGFYRIGCYICPFLRTWEIYIILRNKDILSSLLKLRYFKDFIEAKKKGSPHPSVSTVTHD